jgi:hypothetical protein
LLRARGKYTTRSEKQTPGTFRATLVRERRTNYECFVKVFNSSVEIRVEKARATIEIACWNRALLLFAQLRVQIFRTPAV